MHELFEGQDEGFWGSRILLVSSNEDIHEIANDMVRKGYFLDAIVSDNNVNINSTRENGVESPKDNLYGRWMGVYSYKSYRVSEKVGNYYKEAIGQNTR